MSDEPTMGELGRTMDAFRRDVRDDFTQINIRLDQFVAREVYAADKALWELRVERLEKAAEASRTAARNALYAAIGSFVGAVILAGFTAWVRSGGH